MKLERKMKLQETIQILQEGEVNSLCVDALISHEDDSIEVVQTLFVDIPKSSIVNIHIFHPVELLVEDKKSPSTLEIFFSKKFILLFSVLLLNITMLIAYDKKAYNIISTVMVCVLVHDLYHVYKKAKHNDRANG